MSKAEIHINNRYVFFKNFPTDMLKILHSELAYRDNQAFFRGKAFRRGHWDGMIRLFKFTNEEQTEARCKIGLLPRALMLIDEEIKGKYKVVDKRMIDRNSYDLDVLKNTYQPLRPEQKESILKFTKLNHNNIPITRAILNQPPGSGKSMSMGYLGKVINAYPLLYICNRISLAYQTKRELEKVYRIHIGMISDGKTDVMSNVVVSTIQSIYKAWDLKGDFDEEEEVVNKEAIKKFCTRVSHVQYDECHHVISGTYQESDDIFVNANYTSSCSATLDTGKGDELKIEQMCGPTWYSLTPQYCVEKGYIVPADIYFIHFPKVNLEDNSYQNERKKTGVENKLFITATRKLLSKLRSEGKSCVIMVSTKKFGNLISKELKILFVHGGTKGEEREKIYTRLRNKQILSIVSTVTDEGVDIQSLNAVIVLEMIKAKVKAIQRLRCTRTFPGKEKGMMFIFVTNNKYSMRHYKKLKYIYKKFKGFLTIYEHKL